MVTETWLTGIIGFTLACVEIKPAQDEARAQPPRRRQRGIGIVAEIGVDFGLRDLRADFLRRVGT